MARLLQKLPGFGERMRYFHEQRSDLATLISRWNEPGADGRHLLSLARMFRMTKVLERMLDENEFLSPHGVRALSRYYLDHPYDFDCDGMHYRHEVPARGIRFRAVRRQLQLARPGLDAGEFPAGRKPAALSRLLRRRVHRSNARWDPASSSRSMQVADHLCRRLVGLFLRDEDGRRPVFGDCAIFQTDPHFRDLILFHEYFDGDTGRGLGAGHQTGWTGLVANLIDQLADNPGKA